MVLISVEEPFGSDHRSQLRLQDLQRDFALVLHVLGEIDRRHTTFTELTTRSGTYRRVQLLGVRCVLPTSIPPCVTREGYGA